MGSVWPNGVTRRGGWRQAWKGKRVLRRSLADVVFAVALFSFACTAPAQSPGPSGPWPGCWYQGKWVSYVQPPVIDARPGAAAAASHSRTSAAAGPNAGTGAARPFRAGLAEQAGKPQQGSTPGQSAQPAPQAIVPASFEAEVPPGMDAAYSVQGEPLPAASVGCCESGAGPEVCCGTSGSGPNWLWGRAEYLGWWTEGMHVPALVTTGPVDSPTNVLLFGNTSLNSDGRSGGRFTLGTRPDPCGYGGVEVTYMMLGEETDGFTASSDNFAVLARPFFNVQTGAQDAHFVAMPDPTRLDGSVSVSATTGFQGVELLYRQAAGRSCWSSIDFLLGYRWVQLEDDLVIRESTLVLSGAAPNSTINLFDQFGTGNNFHGAELGVDVRRQIFPCWSLELLGKLAIGNTHSAARAGGSTTTRTAAGETSTDAGGLLALPTNIGTYERDSFASVAELGVTLRRRLTCRLEASLGYTLVYWSEVARAGDQIDLDVNPSQISSGALVGAARPEFSFTTTDFWAQGLNVGLECSF